MKGTVMLEEKDLVRIVENSARRILTELDWKTYANAARKAYNRSDGGRNRKEYERAKRFEDAARDAFEREYGLSSEHGRYGRTYVNGRSGKEESMYGGPDSILTLDGGRARGWAGIHGSEGGDITWGTRRRTPVRHETEGNRTRFSDVDMAGYLEGNPEEADLWNRITDDLGSYSGGDAVYRNGRGWTRR